jgi:hypothetical protein
MATDYVLARNYTNKRSIYVKPTHVFADTTERNDYFTANPGELTENLYILVNSVVYKYLGGDHTDNGNWQDVSPVIQGIQGEQGIQGDTGEGVPGGGTTGQVLAKIDADDFNTEWIDAVAAADDVTYDNAVSGLTATDVQDAIDEVDDDLDTHTGNTTTAHGIDDLIVMIGAAGSPFGPL